MSQLSFFSLRLELCLHGDEIGTGTGFIWRVGDELFLISNFHVITGTYPEDPDRLIAGFDARPDQICFATLAEHEGRYRPHTGCLDLLSGEEFIVHEHLLDGVDLAALKVAFDDNVVVLPNDRLALDDSIEFEVGSDLFIIGFPFGYAAGDLFPIWKRGTVASEPFFLFDGPPRFYVDASTKSGMSGSPVFATRVDTEFRVGPKAAELLEDFEAGARDPMEVMQVLDPGALKDPVHRRKFRFVGVYSAQMMVGEDPDALEDMQLGVVWKRELIDEMFGHPTVFRI